MEPVILALGELLIDFTAKEANTPLKNVHLFEKLPGGAPANVAVGIAHLLGPGTSRIISKIGQDPLGDYLMDALSKERVDTQFILRDQMHQTGVVFVELNQAKPTFILYRNVAYFHLLENDIDPVAFDSIQFVHFGGVTIIDSPSREATFKAVEYARTKGISISFDVNFRDNLWAIYSSDMQHQVILQALRLSDILKFGMDELERVSQLFLGDLTLTDEQSIIKSQLSLAIQIVLKLFPNSDHNLKIIIITNQSGAAIWHAQQYIACSNFHVKVKNTVGAGDSWMACFLVKLFEYKKTNPHSMLSERDVKDCLLYSNATAALKIMEDGAWAVPMRHKLDEFVTKNRNTIRFYSCPMPL